MSTLPEVLETVTLGPDDRLVVFWPPHVGTAELHRAQDVAARLGLTDRVMHVAGAEGVAVLRATKAEGSTVGECGDWAPGLTLPDYSPTPPILCHLASGHTGSHSDGTATWTHTRDLGESS